MRRDALSVAGRPGADFLCEHQFPDRAEILLGAVIEQIVVARRRDDDELFLFGAAAFE